MPLPNPLRITPISAPERTAKTARDHQDGAPLRVAARPPRRGLPSGSPHTWIAVVREVRGGLNWGGRLSRSLLRAFPIGHGGTVLVVVRAITQLTYWAVAALRAELRQVGWMDQTVPPGKASAVMDVSASGPIEREKGERRKP